MEGQDEGATRGIEHVDVRSRDTHLLTMWSEGVPKRSPSAVTPSSV